MSVTSIFPNLSLIFLNAVFKCKISNYLCTQIHGFPSWLPSYHVILTYIYLLEIVLPRF